MAKEHLTIHRAGINQYNPILPYVHKKFTFLFERNITSIAGYTDNETPADAKAVTFSRVSDTEYYIDFVAGQSPFDYTDQTTYLRVTVTGPNGVTEIERQLYIASMPTYPVKIYNWTLQDWQDAYSNYSQSVVEVCGVKFFDAYDDEFGFYTYGGFSHVSIFDGGSNEGDTSEQYVKRQLNQRLEDVKQLYLIKHTTGSAENHWVTFRFKSKSGDTTYYDHDIKIQSVPCYGFLLMNPVYS